MSAQSDIMPDRQEILSSLYGAWRLVCFDKGGMGYFNVSVEGFWRSFFAAVILAPFYMLSISQDFMTPEGGFSFWAGLVHLATYAAGWILFPLVAFFVTDLLSLGHRFTALVVAVNWSSVLIVGFFTVSSLVTVSFQDGLAYLLGMFVTIGVIIYHWFVMRTALETSTSTAMAFVLFNLVLSGMLVLTTDRLI